MFPLSHDCVGFPSSNSKLTSDTEWLFYNVNLCRASVPGGHSAPMGAEGPLFPKGPAPFSLPPSEVAVLYGRARFWCYQAGLAPHPAGRSHDAHRP